ncbi:hypothetical protein [Kingella sp. (in: b-proteobacteria)]|nr:hypothetical protein [Kingella sp. (in: b-proteobacteria)]MDO4657520.1 hypothetical protein [Kingella sp. (in: b-proteobacteria)]
MKLKGSLKTYLKCCFSFAETRFARFQAAFGFAQWTTKTFTQMD